LAQLEGGGNLGGVLGEMGNFWKCHVGKGNLPMWRRAGPHCVPDMEAVLAD
jgi:hypothetical protein